MTHIKGSGEKSLPAGKVYKDTRHPMGGSIRTTSPNDVTGASAAAQRWRRTPAVPQTSSLTSSRQSQHVDDRHCTIRGPLMGMQCQVYFASHRRVSSACVRTRGPHGCNASWCSRRNSNVSWKTPGGWCRAASRPLHRLGIDGDRRTGAGRWRLGS